MFDIISSPRIRRVALGVWLLVGITALWILKRRDPELVIGTIVALPYLLITTAWIAAEIVGVRWPAILIGVLLGLGLWYGGVSAFTTHRSRLARATLDAAIQGGVHTRIRFEWVGDSSGSSADFATPYRIVHEDALFGLWEYVVRFNNGAEYQFDVLDLGEQGWLVRPARTRRASA